MNDTPEPSNKVKLKVPNVAFVCDEDLEQDYWQTKMEYRQGKKRMTVFIPYHHMTPQTFTIFRPYSSKKARKAWWMAHHTGIDNRWNLWHDTFKRGIWHVPFKIISKLFGKVIRI